MFTADMIKIMQHYVDGVEIEFKTWKEKDMVKVWCVTRWVND